MAGILSCLSSNLLLILTFLGVLVGAGLGIGLRPFLLPSSTILLISYPGELFMRLLKLMILPLVIASLITGAASLNAKLNGKMAARTIVYFLSTSLLSSLVGLAFTVAIHPGNPKVKELLGEGTTTERRVELVDNFLDLGRNLIPDNIFQAALQSAITSYQEMEGSDNTTYVTKSVTYRWDHWPTIVQARNKYSWSDILLPRFRHCARIPRQFRQTTCQHLWNH